MEKNKIDEIADKLLSHEAIKFADSAIALQAARTSSGGYQGPSFREAIISALKEYSQQRDEEIVGMVEKMKRRERKITEQELTKDEKTYDEGYNKALSVLINKIYELE